MFTINNLFCIIGTWKSPIAVCEHAANCMIVVVGLLSSYPSLAWPAFLFDKFQIISSFFLVGLHFSLCARIRMGTLFGKPKNVSRVTETDKAVFVSPSVYVFTGVTLKLPILPTILSLGPERYHVLCILI